MVWGHASSVIVAGIELANQLGKLSLSDEDKLEIATKNRGHPDNVAPANFWKSGRSELCGSADQSFGPSLP